VEDFVQIPRSEYDRLREHDGLFDTLSNSAPVLMWMSGVDAACFWFNSQWLDFRGRTLEQEAGNGWAEGVHPEDFDYVLRDYLAAFERRTPFRLKYRILRHDGAYRWLLDQGVPRYGHGGNFQGYIGTCVDITDMEQARLAEHDTVKRLAELATIVETSDDVILSKDLNGIITSWNAAATRVFGYTAEEIVGRSILTLIPEHLHSDEDTILANIRAGRRIEHFETVRKTKDGRLIEVSLTISPITGKDGKVVGASKILRDVSRQKRIEQSLVQAEKLAATGRMAATIAHEVNNPLEAITNCLYLLERCDHRPEVTEYLETAETELKRVSHIAKQTLGYYREHADAKPVRFTDLVQQAMEVYLPRCRAASIEVQLQLTSERKLFVRQGENDSGHLQSCDEFDLCDVLGRLAAGECRGLRRPRWRRVDRAGQWVRHQRSESASNLRGIFHDPEHDRYRYRFICL